MHHRQLGKIVLTAELIFENPDVIIEAFSFLNFLPLWTEHSHIEGTITYIGCAPYFAICQGGLEVPQYTITFQENENGFAGAEFLKV